MELIRPIDYQLSRLMVVIGGALADACFSIPSVVALGVLFLHPEAPASTERALVFGVSVAIGFLIKFSLAMSRPPYRSGRRILSVWCGCEARLRIFFPAPLCH